MADAQTTRIKFRCLCGAKLDAPSHAVGRKARCPKCGRVDTIPDPTSIRSRSAAKREASRRGGDKAKPPQSDMVTLRCQCGAKLTARPSMVGRKAKCPHCGLVVAVPKPEPESGPGTREKAPSSPADDALSLFDGLAEGGMSAAAIVEASLTRSPTTCPRCRTALSGEGSACPACGQAVQQDGLYKLAPPPSSLPSEAPQEPSGPGPECPSCQKTLPRGAVICVDCGINIKTGRSIITSHEGNLDGIYATAENIISLISWLFWIGIYPIASEAFGTRRPYVIRALAAITILTSLWFLVYLWTDSAKMDSLKNLMLWSGDAQVVPTWLQAPTDAEFADYGVDAETTAELRAEVEAELAAELEAWKASLGEYHPYQLITHAFLHGGLLHLAGNLLFLLVLGSRVNALIGSIWTLGLYPVLAILAGAAYMLSGVDQPLRPCVGASGAIMGLAGMYLVLFPVHKVHMAFWYRLGLLFRFELTMKLFAVRGFWVVSFYVAYDVLYTVIGLEDNVAHWAHLGGFIAGVIIALVLLLTRRVNARGGDILSVLLGKRAWALMGRPSRA